MGLLEPCGSWTSFSANSLQSRSILWVILVWKTGGAGAVTNTSTLPSVFGHSWAKGESLTGIIRGEAGGGGLGEDELKRRPLHEDDGVLREFVLSRFLKMVDCACGGGSMIPS